MFPSTVGMPWFLRGKAISARLDEGFGTGTRGNNEADRAARDERTLFVRGLPATLNDKGLFDCFVRRHVSGVVNARVLVDKATGEPLGSGLVECASCEDAIAVASGAVFLDGRLKEGET